MSIAYAQEQSLGAGEYIAVVGSTYMAGRRPVGNPARIERMLRGSNLIVTARDSDGTLVGVGRAISDGEWVCYLADLVVHAEHQRRGIGTGIVDKYRELVGPGVSIVLIAYPDAISYYRQAGLTEMVAFASEREVRD